MKKIFFAFTVLFISVFHAQAQTGRLFEGYYLNEEHQVFVRINLYDKNMKIPGQEFLGDVSGYIGSKKDSRLWFIMDSKITSSNTAQLSVINDYGSEDLEASLTFANDSVCTLKQLNGSQIKFAVNNKWEKVPKVLVLKRRKK